MFDLLIQIVYLISMSIYNSNKFVIPRRAAKLTQLAAAKKLLITPEYMSMLETGARQPSQKLLIRISELYGKPVKYFLKTEPEK